MTESAVFAASFNNTAVTFTSAVHNSRDSSEMVTGEKLGSSITVPNRFALQSVCSMSRTLPLKNNDCTCKQINTHTHKNQEQVNRNQLLWFITIKYKYFTLCKYFTLLAKDMLSNTKVEQKQQKQRKRIKLQKSYVCLVLVHTSFLPSLTHTHTYAQSKTGIRSAVVLL